jgi:hypothetical protein
MSSPTATCCILDLQIERGALARKETPISPLGEGRCEGPSEDDPRGLALGPGGAIRARRAPVERSGSIDASVASETIGAIYNCVFDLALWRDALERICALTGGCAASLTAHAIPEQTPE